MNELLARVLDAHGGRACWNRYTKVEASIVSGQSGPVVQIQVQVASIDALVEAIPSRTLSTMARVWWAGAVDTRDSCAAQIMEVHFAIGRTAR